MPRKRGERVSSASFFRAEQGVCDQSTSTCTVLGLDADSSRGMQYIRAQCTKSFEAQRLANKVRRPSRCARPAMRCAIHEDRSFH
eukprot:3362428-Prymnesium_polylepis.1